MAVAVKARFLALWNQVEAATTEVDYFGARSYHASHGRMLSGYLLHVGAVLEPQRWNRYAYARDGPLTYIDPDGRLIDAQHDKPAGNP